MQVADRFHPHQNRPSDMEVDELTTMDDIANLLNPTDVNGDLSIFPVEVLFELKKIKHRYYKIKEI